MSTYKIELAKSVTKDFKKIAHAMHPSLIAAIENLTDKPFPAKKFKKLKGTLNIFRLRVGDYRIIYDVDETLMQIKVYRVRHRKDVYQK